MDQAFQEFLEDLGFPRHAPTRFRGLALTISFENAAFEAEDREAWREECFRILNDAAVRILRQGLPHNERVKLIDINGNTCGSMIAR